MTQATTAPSVPYDHLLDGPLLELTPREWEALEDSLAGELDVALHSTITFETLGRDPRDFLEVPVDLEETVAELTAQAHIGKARVAVPRWADPWTYVEAATMAAFGRTATSTTPAGDGTWRLTWLLEDEV